MSLSIWLLGFQLFSTFICSKNKRLPLTSFWQFEYLDGEGKQLHKLYFGDQDIHPRELL